MNALVELAGVDKQFGDCVALAALDLAFPAGRTTAVIGPSGCGKSTLLRLVAGLDAPDHGTVRIAGEKVTPAALPGLRRRIGYVIQEGGLFPHLTAEANVTLMARNLGWKRDAMRARVDELCTLTRFPTSALVRYPAELSGGQRQRVSLMRALMLKPELLLLDEPLGALDPLVRAQLQRELKEIFAGLGQTAILVTHDLHEAGFLADEIVLLQDGRIVQRGSLPDLRGAPATPFVREFLEAQGAMVS